MKDISLQTRSALDLLSLYSRILDQLFVKGIVRTVNNPVADYAEYLVRKTFSLTPVEKSTKGYDAQSKDGYKYEVKARRQTKRSKPTRFSAIRDLEGKHFDYLIAVVFSEEFRVVRAARLTFRAVEQRAFYQEHINGWILPINNDLWSDRGIKDVTAVLQANQMEGTKNVPSE